MYICSMYMWKCLSILGVLAWLFTVAPASSPSPPPPPPIFTAYLSVETSSTLSQLLHPHLPVPRVLSIVPSCNLVIRLSFSLWLWLCLPHSNSPCTLPSHPSLSTPLPLATDTLLLASALCAASYHYVPLALRWKWRGMLLQVWEKKIRFVLLWQCTFMYSTVHFGMYHSRLRIQSGLFFTVYLYNK